MFYEYAITVPKETLASAPKEEWLPLPDGIILQIDVQFPIGTLGLVHVRLEHHTFPHFPQNYEGNIASDGFIVPIMGPIDFHTEPYTIKAILWNLDDTYQHIITIRVNMTESKAAMWFLGIMKGLEKFLKMVGIKGA